VTNGTVALNAAHRVVCPRTTAHDVVDEIAVATEAIVLKDLAICGLDSNRLFEDLSSIQFVRSRRLKGEPHRVVITIAAFREVFSKKVRWDVTVIAVSDGVVRSLSPRVELLVHDVAVRTGLSVVTQVG
jgi:hypothetical protein